MTKREIKRKKLLGELESKKIIGGELILLKREKENNMGVYQISLFVNGTYANLLSCPNRYSPTHIKKEYNQISSFREFWEKKDELEEELGLGTDDFGPKEFPYDFGE